MASSSNPPSSQMTKPVAEPSAAHTPGPWHIGYAVGWNAAPIMALPDGKNELRVATLSRNVDKPIAQKEADARLIAAAPDGLAAAKALTAKYVARDFPQYMRGDWLALEAFVAKATGGA